MSSRRALLVVGFLLLPCVASAEAITGCHCYQNRTFDPERPGAVDEYVLATSRSSLLSAAFGRSKRELVEAVMTGTSPDDLWIADWAAARTGQRSPALLEAKAAGRPWSALLASAKGLGKPFGSALARGATDAELAAVAVDDVLVTRLRAQPSHVAALRKAGASSSEVILAVVLAARARKEPAAVFEPVRARKGTWGVVLQGLGLTPKEIDALVRGLVAG